MLFFNNTWFKGAFRSLFHICQQAMILSEQIEYFYRLLSPHFLKLDDYIVLKIGRDEFELTETIKIQEKVVVADFGSVELEIFELLLYFGLIFEHIVKQIFFLRT